MHQTADTPPSVPVSAHESTPWPGTGKMSGNLFEDRNWLLLPNYLDNDNENKTENEPKIAASVTSPRPPIKEEVTKLNDQATEKCSWGPDCPFCKSQENKEEQNKVQQQKMSPKPKLQKPQARRPKTLKLEYDKSQAAMGSRNGKVEFQIQPLLFLRFRVGLRIR